MDITAHIERPSSVRVSPFQHAIVDSWRIKPFLNGSVLVAGLLAATGPAYSAEIVVDDGSVLAVANDGKCSLVEAIHAANTDATVDSCVSGSGPDSIILPENGDFVVREPDNLSYNGTANGLPQIVSDITIEGNGSVIQREEISPAFRFLEVAGSPNSGKLTLRGTTLENGSAGDDEREFGGAIWVRRDSEVLTLEQSIFVGNSSHNGGAIRADVNSPITVIGSRFVNNRARVSSAISGGGGLSISHSVVTGNSSDQAPLACAAPGCHLHHTSI